MTRTYRILHGRTYRRSNRRENRRSTVLLLITIVVLGIVIGSLLFNRQTTQASSAYETVVHYRSIEVAEGDTLWDLAGEYGGYQDRRSYIDEVIRLNHIENETIHAGAYLVVPYEETIPIIK